MKRLKSIFILGLCFQMLASQAQYTPETLKLKKYKSGKEYFNSYFSDTKDIIISPFRWKKKDWLIAGSTLAVGSALYMLDNDIRNAIQHTHSGFTNAISDDFAEPFGSGLYALPIIAGLYLHGEITHNMKSKTVAYDAIKVYVLTAATVTAMKYVFKRHRPYQDEIANPRNWGGPFGNSQFESFPSGHTAIAFALATYLSMAYKDKSWVAITSYSVAGLVGYSRMLSDNHWASDVFVGAVIGWSIGKLVYNKSLQKYNITLLPISHTGLGLTLIKSIK